MKNYTIPIISLLLLLFTVSCDSPPPSYSYSGNSGLSSAFEHATGSPSSKKGNFTILLASFTLDNKIMQSQALQQRAKRVLNTEDIWLNSKHGQIDVNYGYFKTHKEATKQKEKVKNIYRSLGLGPYQFYYVKEIPKPDPPAPAEWNILNNHCAYSLQVGMYYNVPEKKYFDRKADAVLAVDAYRNNNDPAYFYHGEHESYVLMACIGANPSMPILKIIQKKFPFSYENGFKVSVGSRIQTAAGSASGKIVKTPKTSFIVDLSRLTGTASGNSR